MKLNIILRLLFTSDLSQHSKGYILKDECIYSAHVFTRGDASNVCCRYHHMLQILDGFKVFPSFTKVLKSLLTQYLIPDLHFLPARGLKSIKFIEDRQYVFFIHLITKNTVPFS